MTHKVSEPEAAPKGPNGGGGGGPAGRTDSPPEPVSLPIRDDYERRLRLAMERRREYNDFLSRKEAEEEAKRLRRRKHSRRATSHLEHLRPTAVQNKSQPMPPKEQSDNRKSRADHTVSADANHTASILPAINGQSSASGAKNDKDGRRSRLCNGTKNGELAVVATLKEETAKLKEEREEFAKLEVMSEVQKPSTRAVLTACISRSRGQSPGHEDADAGDHVPAQWERSQSLDRGLKGATLPKDSALTLRKGGSQPTQLGTGAASLTAGTEVRTGGSERAITKQEAYLKDLEAQIKEKQERMLQEKLEEARLDRKCIEEYQDPWGRDLATTFAGGKRPRFLGDLVQPILTSSDIMPSKARSESNLFGDPRRQREVAMLVPNLHLLLARRGEGVLFKPSRKLVRNVLPPSLYRKELQKQQETVSSKLPPRLNLKQIEEKQHRLDEQRRRDQEEEEKLDRRVQQQQAKMYQEYQEERKRHRAKDQVTRRPEQTTKGQQEKERMMIETKRSVPHVKPQKSVTRPPEDSRKIRSGAAPDFRPPRRRSVEAHDTPSTSTTQSHVTGWPTTLRSSGDSWQRNSRSTGYNRCRRTTLSPRLAAARTRTAK
ncbi:uncharacterized protein LOC119164848 isoform X3 [Rhipicephalus microplus]|uniref:uncharacterized protein LOC119164848 isoform X3 n=1 Tax=Rhipicephalus microplus TaxID=6941 RepID=UPI003F6BFBCC